MLRDGKFTGEITPRIFIDSTRVKPEINEGGLGINLRVLGLTKIISADLALFGCRLLLAYAHLSILLSSEEHE